jgi:hypothetical protein
VALVGVCNRRPNRLGRGGGKEFGLTTVGEKLRTSSRKRGPFADEEAGPEIPDARGRGTQFGKRELRTPEGAVVMWGKNGAFAFPVGRSRCSAIRHPELRNAGRPTGPSRRVRRASEEVRGSHLTRCRDRELRPQLSVTSIRHGTLR